MRQVLSWSDYFHFRVWVLIHVGAVHFLFQSRLKFCKIQDLSWRWFKIFIFGRNRVHRKDRDCFMKNRARQVAALSALGWLEFILLAVYVAHCARARIYLLCYFLQVLYIHIWPFEPVILQLLLINGIVFDSFQFEFNVFSSTSHIRQFIQLNRWLSQEYLLRLIPLQVTRVP